MYPFIGAILAGVVLGFLGGKVWILIIWAVAGLIIGYNSKNSRKAIINGALFGFLAGFFFMVQGYNGASSLISRVPFFALIGLLTSLGGVIASFAGSILHKGLKKK